MKGKTYRLKAVTHTRHVSIGKEAIERHRGDCAELSKLELDMAILGQLGALDHRGPTSGGVHRRDVVRAHTRCEFYFEGKNMQKCFLVSLWNSVPKHGARPPAPLTPPAPKRRVH